MSIYGEWRAATIASAGQESAEVDLGRDYDWVSLEIPQMDNCQLYLKVAEISGGTFYDLGRDINQGDMTVFNTRIKGLINEEDIEEEEELFNHADVWRLGGWRYIKVAATAPQSAERLIRVRGMRY